jgi:hypothetical protein
MVCMPQPICHRLINRVLLHSEQPQYLSRLIPNHSFLLSHDSLHQLCMSTSIASILLQQWKFNNSGIMCINIVGLKNLTSSWQWRLHNLDVE